MFPPDGRGLPILFLKLTFLLPPGITGGCGVLPAEYSKWIGFCCWSFRLPSGGCPVGAMARPRRGNRFRKVESSLFLEADNVNVTQSLELFFDAIFIRCRIRGYRCRVVDAIVNMVLPREVAQAAMISTALVSWSFVRDVGKELPWDGPVVFLSFRGDRLSVQLETSPACMFIPVIPQGQLSYLRALHILLGMNFQNSTRFYHYAQLPFSGATVS